MLKTRPPFRRATVSEYLEWLQGHLINGGGITHVYDYPLSRWDFLVALRDATIDGECGANAASIIVPEGISITGRLGHNNLFLMEGFTVRGGIVPVFSDPGFDVIPGIEEAREQEARQTAALEARARQVLVRRDSDLSEYLQR